MSSGTKRTDNCRAEAFTAFATEMKGAGASAIKEMAHTPGQPRVKAAAGVKDLAQTAAVGAFKAHDAFTQCRNKKGAL
ncbi:hypothetical protein tinsulaeT_37080 [Thalassotalea insulae]|uniref:Uncharacterized protein n=1 Tax=Thalassotalea insulae TaxID=2056778 RepID=A0ABQ6GWS8_9GAMM|nr:hypothetical protein [Thalassotalea insulae]GLX80368.1 hypothetical protein tinsulaeT_37080 [Thalassotalea insulae]